jgi:hypothetical protein
MSENKNIEQHIKDSTTEVKEERTEQKSSENKPAGAHALGLLNWLIIVCLIALSSTASVFLYDRFYAPRLVAFDLQGYLSNQRAAMLKNQLTEKELGNNLDTLKVKLDNIPSNKAVITADVVLRNIEVLKLD